MIKRQLKGGIKIQIINLVPEMNFLFLIKIIVNKGVKYKLGGNAEVHGVGLALWSEV